MIEYYTDGSWQKSNHPESCGWGFVCVKDDERIAEDFGSGIPEGKHVTGELVAAMKAIQHAVRNGYKNITIVYDNEGVGNWALGNWKRNNSRTQAYYEWTQEAMKSINIEFKWTKAHVGNKWNEYADSLAKKGVSVPREDN